MRTELSATTSMKVDNHLFIFNKVCKLINNGYLCAISATVVEKFKIKYNESL